MKVSPTVAALAAALLVTLNFLQLEQNISHPLHIVFGSVSIFLATLLKPEKT